jgi:AcrR family transcriptional regulator
MSVTPVRDRRAERTAATRREILDAAWELVRAEGLASLTMRDLGTRVGMRAQSLYRYYTSKHAIYDAMFADANHALLRRLRHLPEPADPEQSVRQHARGFLDFALEDPVRYQLLFQRTIPGFEPSPESYAPAVQALEIGRAALRACGISSERAMDAFTALNAGIAAQQTANEPGGTRWVRLADEIWDMYFAHYRSTKSKGKQ